MSDTYQVYRAPGWHGEPHDPLIHETGDEREAAMLAGERVDIHMPGECNRYSAYALGPAGEAIERIESFRCDSCGELLAWGDDGPIGMMDGRILECPQAVEKHLVTWVCDDCVAAEEQDDD